MHLEGPEIAAGEGQDDLPSEDEIRDRCGAGEREGAAEAQGGGKPGKCRAATALGLLMTRLAGLLPLLRHSSNICVLWDWLPHAQADAQPPNIFKKENAESVMLRIEERLSKVNVEVPSEQEAPQPRVLLVSHISSQLG